MKIRAVDTLFSKYIRTRDGWNCQRCGKKYTPPTGALHCSHYHGRRKESVRFDPENADAHCYGCHSFFEQNPNEHYDWKLKQLGENRLNNLAVRANTPGKRDDKMTKIILKELMKTL